MRLHQGTFLGVAELAFALAVFVRLRSEKPGAVRKHLEVTQREAFDDALAWLDRQPKLVRRLAEQPETLEDGVFELQNSNGVLSRLLAGRRRTAATDAERPGFVETQAPAGATRRERSPEELRRIAETKALVEEALQER
jgi:hypothetical protein